jgi:transcriptional regulator with XRE-family HTH domain
MAVHSPATTRRRLRVELRRMREDAGLAQADVVNRLDWSQSKLIRIENGAVGLSVTDAKALLSVYRAPEDVSDELVALARKSRVRTWWSQYRDVLNAQYQEFVGFEADASRLRQFNPTIIPGLLQAEPYVRALIPALVLSPLESSTFDSLVEVRLRRQREVLHGERPPELTAVIDEAALRRPVGGLEAMRAQLSHLVDLQRDGTATIAILPFAAGPHVGMQGAFSIMDFDDDADASVLFTESAQGNMALRDQPEVITLYEAAFNRMLDLSIRGEAAATYVRDIAAELTSVAG